MPNRLSGSSSAYLRQNQDNPVDWYPWGDEAIQKAVQENKPIFLSVGYSSCHWCHVMAHESFEDLEVAEKLREGFICIKVDREERPDIDETYMAAVHLSNGRGGWPMTVFLTPELNPFFAGTYFPKNSQSGMPGLMEVLNQISTAWKTRRPEVNNVAEEFKKALQQLMNRQAPASSQKLDQDFLAKSVQVLVSSADLEHGGFGGSPKFPPHTAISFLLTMAGDPTLDTETQGSALAIALLSLERMAKGGIHDHVGGGYHRYSVDEKWFLPHFEKMLYDNALMLANLSRAEELVTGKDEELALTLRQAREGIVRWLREEMTLPNGLLSSAIDADSVQGEGWYYTWTLDEIKDVLGEDAEAFIKDYNATQPGNFGDEATGKSSGRNILYLSPDSALPNNDCLIKLRQARSKRERPMRDDKAIVGWNALTVKGLAIAGEVELAKQIASGLLAQDKAMEQLPHLAGAPETPAFLDDYAYLTDALFTLHQVTQEAIWHDEAIRLTQAMVGRFYDADHDGFFFTEQGHQELFGRSKPVFDQPIPSANAIAIQCLVQAGQIERAEKSLRIFQGWLDSAPQMCEALLEAGKLLIANGGAAAIRPTYRASVSVEPEVWAIDSDGVIHGQVILDLPSDLHIDCDGDTRALSIRVKNHKVQAVLPEPTNGRWEGKVIIPISVSGFKESSDLSLSLVVTYVACLETECFAPISDTISIEVQG